MLEYLQAPKYRCFQVNQYKRSCDNFVGLGESSLHVVSDHYTKNVPFVRDWFVQVVTDKDWFVQVVTDKNMSTRSRAMLYHSSRYNLEL